ncbi:unnamed protein product [Cuscuta epithymum]|uniref:Peptidase C1A papain C-terminal domain-containing protein n=1 Tax=Cuscuta epithymum TaxID=186058 RepID=A0AAV0CAZ5_9ASTE|nr:unnamed protein product [Cuscuta epithymum]
MSKSKAAGSSGQDEPQRMVAFNWNAKIKSKIVEQEEDICWAIALAHSLEGTFNSGDQEVELSFDDIVYQLYGDKDTHKKARDSSDRKLATRINKAYKNVQVKGIAQRRYCPYTVENRSSRKEVKRLANQRHKYDCLFIAKFESKEKVNEKTLLSDLQHQPIVGVLDSTPNFLKFMGKGIYTVEVPRAEKEQNLHCVVIVDWGEEHGKKFWVVRNSYGENWGDKGIGKLQMGPTHCSSIFLEYYYATKESCSLAKPDRE